MRARYPHEQTSAIAKALGRPVGPVYQRAAKLGLSKSEAFYASDRSGRVQRGKQNPAMRATQFKAGHDSWNKGLKGSTGTHENCRRTQFKKGTMAGAAQHNYVPVGSERISKDGYLERKVTDDHPVPARRWIGVHRIVWEAANGPVPPGHAVAFLPGRRTTEAEHITLDALELVSRQELMRRNSYHNNYPKDVAQLIQLKGALNRKINRRSKA
nr:HNH endonuclease [Luteibacter yeojuensis]